jgi:murein DD-endopeptidase MepM/ murein hydrolase activator NlpD
MSWRISAAVGRWEAGARNQRRDVETVQTLLASAALALNDPRIDPGDIDGSVATSSANSATVRAIQRFQEAVGLTADGVVEVNRRTWNELVRVGGGSAPGANANTAGQSYFPFVALPASDWTSGMRAFGANRSGGTRAHAGCDLYFPQGTWIHAVTDGVVVNGPYWFYSQTFALEVDHGDMIVRYGEIQPDSPVRTGDRVQAGQRIARVGRLVGITVPSDMLHIEVYDKSAAGPLTVHDEAASVLRADGVPFGRRKDLIDPTSLLQDWAARLPQ